MKSISFTRKAIAVQKRKGLQNWIRSWETLSNPFTLPLNCEVKMQAVLEQVMTKIGQPEGARFDSCWRCRNIYIKIACKPQDYLQKEDLLVHIWSNVSSFLLFSFVPFTRWRLFLEFQFPSCRNWLTEHLRIIWYLPMCMLNFRLIHRTQSAEKDPFSTYWKNEKKHFIFPSVTTSHYHLVSVFILGFNTTKWKILHYRKTNNTYPDWIGLPSI